ncbi:MAG: hypothetical protein M3Z08_17830, partial [Chloroflexota bacterium]|nr:hypothetical protein [Chloroflexota bacterium]
LTIGLIGPGSYALDALFGIALPEVPVFAVLAVAALLVDSIGIIITSRHVTVAQSESTSRAS